MGQQIIQWNKEDKDIPVDQRKPIKIYIYSYGGELESALSFIAIMNLSKTPIYTYNLGIAYSAALLIAISGHKRYALPFASALLHEGSAHLSGSADEVRNAQNYYENQLKEIVDYICEHTAIDKKTYAKYKEKDWYFSIDSMLQYKMIDEVISDIDNL